MLVTNMHFLYQLTLCKGKRQNLKVIEENCETEKREFNPSIMSCGKRKARSLLAKGNGLSCFSKPFFSQDASNEEYMIK